jgi:adenine nucleotide transporter 17
MSITFYYSVIKARMQVKSKDEEGYASIWDAFTKIVANEGIGGLYKGISSKIVQSVLTAAFLFMAKEALFDWAVWVLVLSRARPAKNTITKA